MKIAKTISTIFLVTSILSCGKQLDQVPTDFITSTNYYNNETQLNNGLNAVYDVLGNAAGYGEALLSYLSYTNDEGIFVFTQTAYIQRANFSYSASEATLTSLWNALYKGINNANIIIEACDAPNAAAVDAKIRDNIKAQALFLRAYYFFMLADRWGAVPMPLKASKSPDEVNMASTPLAELYGQIAKDMEAAEAVLPTAASLGPNSSGRISKNTAQGVLARIYLSMTGFPLNDESKYARVIDWCKKVMESGENSLDPSYADLFVKQARDEYYVKENMWEIEFYGNVSDNYREQAYVGVRNGVAALQGTTYPGYGYNFLGASIILYNKYQQDPVTFLSKDLRRDRNVAPYQWVGGTAAVQEMTRSYWPMGQSLYQRWPGKWRREEEVSLPRFKNGNGTNFPLLRYSDVLLMFAEAENHLNGPTAAAYAAINQVRERAYGTGYRVKALTLTDPGSGYTAAPTVDIAAGSDPNGAHGAKAYAAISGGKVSVINLVSMGAFYGSAPPVVTINSTNGAGTGAKATAVVEVINPAEADLPSGLSKEAFFEEIKDERMRELAFECLRAHDLRRWGIFIPTIKSLAQYAPAAPSGTIRTAYQSAADNIDTRHLYYPIPPSEIATNADIVQNPGW